jgi:hypothetical protein
LSAEIGIGGGGEMGHGGALMKISTTPLARMIGLMAVLAMEAERANAAESIGGKIPARAARSVHLQWSAAESEAFYVEATVEQSTPGTYVSAIGWSGGYFGVQELRDGKKVAIFSVWDPTKGDDPKAVKPEERVELLHEGAGVRIKRFGGEGTGGQCMVDFPWAVGEPVRFLVRAEVHDAPGIVGGKTAYAGWIFDPAQKAWRHLVTFRTRNNGKLLRGVYSFVEDFRRDTKSADDVRRAQLGNAWMKPRAGEWQAVAQAKFTASRADWEARDTINAGPAGDGFFLATGGDTRRVTELTATMKTEATPAAVPGDVPAAVWASSVGAVLK